MSVWNHHFSRAIAAVSAVAMLALAAGCGSGGAAESSDPNDVKQMTVSQGTLTVATGEPAYSPWVLDDNPESGRGYEAAVVYSLAKHLGFAKEDVKWTRSTFDAATAPGAKDWDMNVQQFSITKERKQAVDFSPSYFNMTESVVTRKDSKFAKATSLSELKDATIGAMVGSISLDIAKSKIKDDIKVFNDNATVVQAMSAGQVDAVVFDTPTAVNVVKTKQVPDGMVLGQIPDSQDPNGIGVLMPKDSKLTPTVTKAMNEMKNDGELQKLQDRWLKEYTTDVPELK